ncbi:MAG: hypothetical protein KAX65_05525, partial [Caldilineaceae bacterium]|nr:hypothetical protein [Caldilineaceae bacterium]
MTVSITTRSSKGSPLTNNEIDANFINLKAAVEGADAAIAAESLARAGDFSAHVAAADPHTQYTTDDEATDIANDAVVAHVAAADPHTQYTTDDEATALAVAAIAAAKDVREFANLAAFPVSGTAATVYIAADSGLMYRWDGAAYAPVGLQPIADKTLLGNVSGGTAAPVALNQTQARGIVLPARMAFEDTAPTAANTVTGVGSVALFGSNNVIGSNGIASLSSDGITTTKTAFHTRLVADIASTGTIYNTAHRSAVIASNNCEMGTSASGTADTYAHLNAIVASANCVVKQSASGGQQSVTLVAASYGASITGNQQYTAYIGSYSIT